MMSNRPCTIFNCCTAKYYSLIYLNTIYATSLTFFMHGLEYMVHNDLFKNTLKTTI